MAPLGHLIPPLPQQEVGQAEESPQLSGKERPGGLVSSVSRMGEEAEEGRRGEWLGGVQKDVRNC